MHNFLQKFHISYFLSIWNKSCSSCQYSWGIAFDWGMIWLAWTCSVYCLLFPTIVDEATHLLQIQQMELVKHVVYQCMLAVSYGINSMMIQINNWLHFISISHSKSGHLTFKPHHNSLNKSCNPHCWYMGIS